MRPLLKFVNLRGKIGIYEQLKIEELFMRHQKDNWYLLNTGIDQPSIVLGISGKVHELVNLKRCIEDEIPLIRRFSGGTPLTFVVYLRVDCFTCFCADETECHKNVNNICLLLSLHMMLLLHVIRRDRYRGPLNIVRYLHFKCKCPCLLLF